MISTTVSVIGSAKNVPFRLNEYKNTISTMLQLQYLLSPACLFSPSLTSRLLVCIDANSTVIDHPIMPLIVNIVVGHCGLHS